MGIWSKASKTHVAHMQKGDFFGSEQSTTVTSNTDVVIEHVAPDGTTTILKESVPLEAGRALHLDTLAPATPRSRARRRWLTVYARARAGRGLSGKTGTSVGVGGVAVVGAVHR